MQISGIAKAGAELLGKLDGIITSGEERGKLRLLLREYQQTTARELIKLEQAEVDTRGKLILAEAKGTKLQRSWRPILALAFGAIPVWNYLVVILLEWGLKVAEQFGARAIAAPPRLEMPTALWGLLTVMIGGYVGSRWHEKVKASEGLISGSPLDFGKGAGGYDPKIAKRLVKMIRKEKDPGIRKSLVDQLRTMADGEPELT